MVGIVVTISPNFSLYKIVVLPAASKPTINILISFLPKRPLNKFENIFPILPLLCYDLKKRNKSQYYISDTYNNEQRL